MVKRLCLAAALVLGVSVALPAFVPKRPAPYIEEKKRAVFLAAEARAVIGDRLLGVEYSETTTTLGHKDAKILSAAPDFPALLVQWLKDAGITRGDAVAINASGSFPALTVAALSAVKAVGARPLLIASLGSSSWGANRPEQTWLHMEKDLTARWPEYASLAVSLGGGGDMAEGMAEEGFQALRRALELTDALVLEPENGMPIAARRIEVWKRANNGTLPDALINTGGNAAFWGVRERDVTRLEGLTIPADPGSGADMDATAGDGVGDVFLRAGKPVVHMLGIKKMAARYRVTIPSSPESPLWVTADLSPAWRAFAFFLLAGIMAALTRMNGTGCGPSGR